MQDSKQVALIRLLRDQALLNDSSARRPEAKTIIAIGQLVLGLGPKGMRLIANTLIDEMAETNEQIVAKFALSPQQEQLAHDIAAFARREGNEGLGISLALHRARELLGW